MTFKKIFKNPIRVCAYFLVVIGLYFAVAGIIAAKGVLAPVIVALILAMLSVPLARKIESWKIARVWSSLMVLLVNILTNVHKNPQI